MGTGPDNEGPDQAEINADREREAGLVGAAWESLPKRHVAVLVFVEARGVDRDDAQNRAVDAVSRAVRGVDRQGVLPVTHRGLEVLGAFVRAVEVKELGRAAGNGLLSIRPAGIAFR